MLFRPLAVGAKAGTSGLDRRAIEGVDIRRSLRDVGVDQLVGTGADVGGLPALRGVVKPLQAEIGGPPHQIFGAPSQVARIVVTDGTRLPLSQ